MLKRLLAVILSLCLLASTMVGMTLTVSADNPEVLYVNGVDILTAEDNTVACGSGTAVYNTSDGTLTLTDAEITTSYQSYGGIYSKNGDLSIVLQGDNRISGLSYGINTVSGNLTISGTGNVDLYGITVYGISAFSGVTTFSETTITSSDTDYPIVSGVDIVVKNSTLNLEGFFQALTGGDVTICEQSVVTCTSDVSEACAVCGEAVSITDSTVTLKCTADDSYPAIDAFDEVTITNSTVELESAGSNAIYAYEISITDSEVTASGYYAALYGDTGVTLTDSVITAESSADVAIYSPEDIYIEDGTVTATGGDSCVGIFARGKISISGIPTIISYDGIKASDGIVITITDETLEVKVGTSESDLTQYTGSPFSSDTTIGTLSSGYILIQPHSNAHTYSDSVWVWDGNTAIATFTCSDCGDVQTVEATVESSNILGVVTRTATVTFNGETYTDTYTSGTSLLIIGALTQTEAEEVDSEEVDSEEVEIDEPVEGTDTETESDEETPVEENPTTGAVVALLPLAIAIATAVASKRR
ncbi:MAG: hypothetical protein LUH18_09860 [Oscillospiraceae bacterium]|nr:hypothetical protein [Oscillospiraceae bacterium]